MSDPRIRYTGHPLTAEEIQRAGAEYARGVSIDRQRFLDHQPGYCSRPTLPLELRALLQESGLPGVPGAFPKWPAGFVLMRQAGRSVERRLFAVAPSVASEQAQFFAQHPLLAWPLVDQALQAGEPLVFADMIALGAGA